MTRKLVTINIHRTVYLRDEIDKYLDVRVEREYEIYQKSETDGKGSVMIKSFDAFRESTKNTFLFDMLAVLERDGLKKSVVVIFCSNNFHTIFEGVDLTHHKSLYDRFLKVNFELCDHDEIISYICHYNEKFKGTKYQCLVSIDELEKNLDTKILVTHRTLHQISIECQYDPIKLVDRLNRHIIEDLDAMMTRRSPVDSPIRKLPTMILVNGTGKDKSPKPRDKDSSSESSSTSESSSDDDVAFEDIKDITIETTEAPHEKLWRDKYVSLTSRAPQREIVTKIREIMSEFDKTAIDSLDRRLEVVRLMDYLADTGFQVMVRNPKFMKTVQEKIKEFYDGCPEIFPLFKEDTKEFIYAASGILL